MSNMNYRELKPGTFSHFTRIIANSGLVGILYYLPYLAMTLFTRYRSHDDFAEVDSTCLIKIVAALLLFSAVLLKLTSRFNFSQFIDIIKTPPIYWLLLYILWSAVTLLWTPILLYSGWMLFENIVYLSAIILIFIQLKNDPDDFIHYLFYYAMFTFFVRLTKFIIADTPINVHTVHGMGALTTAPLLFLALYYPTRYWIKLFFIVVTCVSTATSMYLSVAVIELVACFTAKRKAPHITIVLLAIMGLLFFGSQQGKNLLFFGKSERAIETGSGRLAIFEQTLSLGMTKPITGHGFCSLNVVIEQSPILRNINLVNTHNFVLESLIHSGLFGALLISLFYMSMITRTYFRTRRTKFYLPILYTAITLCIVAFFNPSVGGRVYGAWELTVFVAVLIAFVSKGQPHKPRYLRPPPRITQSIPPARSN